MVKRFKIKDDVTFDHLRVDPEFLQGGSYIRNDVVLVDSKPNLINGIDLELGFPTDLSKWNDQDYILVLDFDALQPFEPFYTYAEKGSISSKILEKLEKEYNNWMSSRWYLEEIKDI